MVEIGGQRGTVLPLMDRVAVHINQVGDVVPASNQYECVERLRWVIERCSSRINARSCDSYHREPNYYSSATGRNALSFIDFHPPTALDQRRVCDSKGRPYRLE